jgi:hypothetical protein
MLLTEDKRFARFGAGRIGRVKVARGAKQLAD